VTGFAKRGFCSQRLMSQFMPGIFRAVVIGNAFSRFFGKPPQTFYQCPTHGLRRFIARLSASRWPVIVRTGILGALFPFADPPLWQR
jgi:hypothetical protein